MPESIGGYQLLERLGSGGMGEVFLAHDETLSRQIALKRVRPDRQIEDVRQRFEVEARVTALLQHPSILPVYDLTTTESGSFYTMRPVEGITLAELLELLRHESDRPRQEWPVARLVRLFLQAANAVAYAHSQGVIHRDLKPSNIMLGPFEEVLVLDWGMAKIRSASAGAKSVAAAAAGVEGRAEDVGMSSAPLDALARVRDDTASKLLLGTPGYMAPELLDGAIADERADVFSLGVILYELLTLRKPWRADTVQKLAVAMTQRPRHPSLLQPGRSIPAHLGKTVLRALAHDPEQRYHDVVAFSSDVAHALEGRASWQLEPATHDRDKWRMQHGRARVEDDGTVVLSSRGERRSLRYFCIERFGESVCLELDVRLQGRSELAIWLSAGTARERRPDDGYSLDVFPGKRRTLSLQRSGRIVAGAKRPALEPRRWYHVIARRERDHLSLLVDGEEIYSYSDPIPLPGGFVGLTAQAGALQIRNFELSSLGTSATVSCLSVPDAFFHRELFEEARAEYGAVATSHPGRSEGRLARFRSGLCLIEMCRREGDPGLRELLLTEAEVLFEAGRDTCLGPLGVAMARDEAADYGPVYDALHAALTAYPEDPHLPIVHEWLLGRLHRLGLDERQAAAQLLPLAVDHCFEGWARPLIQDQVRQLRRGWETPSFLSGRSTLKQRDRASRADANLFFSFWAGRTEPILVAYLDLLQCGSARPHHLADAFFALLELGDENGARRALHATREVFEDLQQQPDPGQRDEKPRGEKGEKGERTLDCCAAVELALNGDPEAACAQLGPHLSSAGDRAVNSARLWTARLAERTGLGSAVHRVLRPRGPRDSFAREHLAWFALRNGDQKRARAHLKPFVDHGQHLAGRNLSNFLYGCLLLSRDQAAEAQRVFASLPAASCPRTWTLGSHAASGRLGGGSIERYRAQAFPWELAMLDSHLQLLHAVGGGGAIDAAQLV